MQTTPHVMSTRAAFLSYAGTYTYDPVRRVVTHRPEMATYPPFVGAALSREVRLDGDRVVLTEPSGVRDRARLTWEPVRAP